MDKKQTLLSMIAFVGIFLLVMGLFFGGSNNFASADDVKEKIKDKDYIDSIRTDDSINKTGDLTKRYIANEKELKIENDGELLVNLKLLTPYENKISSSGNDPIALFQSINHSDDWKLFEKMDSYKINDDYKVKSKDYYYKYLIETEKEVCNEVVQNNSFSKENKTTKQCSTYTQKDWVKFNNAKDLPQGSIFGVFTNNLVEGEHIEVVYGIEGFDIYEWASYLVTDLVSYYKMDESSGVVVDNLGDYNGTNDGATRGITGKINNAFDFTATNTDDIILPSGIFSFMTSSDFTFSTWIKTDNSADQGIINARGDANAYLDIGRNTNEKVSLTIYDGSPAIAATSTTSVTDGDWHFIVGTHDGTNIRIYVDGDLEDTTAQGRPSSRSTTENFIGTSVGYYMDGLIDEVGIFSKALNQTEITDLYNNGNGLTYPFEITNCQFSGYVLDAADNALESANVTITNQYNQSEWYNATTDSNGLYAINITNSTNTYKMEARYNGSTLGAAKHDILGTC